ncbi:MAG TPA: NUDIX hydrolase [Symbiobacteriaceae bacterium]|nr:NUDIX hydrolase [Symbiobacteriaceae bacterium]
MSNQAERFAQKIVVGVLAAVTDPRGRVLFVAQQKGPYAGSWLLPGGGVEPGESARDAVIREIREETGLELASPRFFGTYELQGAWSGGRYHLLMLAFHGQAQGEIPEGFQGDGVGEVRWAHIGELPLHSTDLQILTDAGLAQFTEAEVAAALSRDGITLTAYQTA